MFAVSSLHLIYKHIFLYFFLPTERFRQTCLPFDGIVSLAFSMFPKEGWGRPREEQKTRMVGEWRMPDDTERQNHWAWETCSVFLLLLLWNCSFHLSPLPFKCFLQDIQVELVYKHVRIQRLLRNQSIKTRDLSSYFI